jgi:hypothetical protein
MWWFVQRDGHELQYRKLNQSTVKTKIGDKGEEARPLIIFTKRAR